jgi:hypothetical protein
VSTDRDRRLAELLQEAAEIHHTVYRITDGDDPDWASWYAAWLLELSELPTSSTLDRSEVTSCTRSSNSTATTPPRSRQTGGKTGTPAA